MHCTTSTSLSTPDFSVDRALPRRKSELFVWHSATKVQYYIQWTLSQIKRVKYTEGEALGNSNTMKF